MGETAIWVDYPFKKKQLASPQLFCPLSLFHSCIPPSLLLMAAALFASAHDRGRQLRGASKPPKFIHEDHNNRTGESGGGGGMFLNGNGPPRVLGASVARRPRGRWMRSF